MGNNGQISSGFVVEMASDAGRLINARLLVEEEKFSINAIRYKHLPVNVR